MFIAISNSPRDYAWGSRTAIADALGRAPSGGPEAELWLGAHGGSPATVLDPELTGGAATLDAWIAAEPDRALGAAVGHGRLPFLLKLLAAEAPLSLQAHPSLERARAGFAEENARGVPLDAPHRNYRDDLHKPELVYVLSETFEALCGFRDPAETRALLELLAAAGAEGVPALAAALERGLGEAVTWILDPAPDRLAEAARMVPGVADAAREVVAAGTAGRWGAELETVSALAAAYPDDPGVVLALLLNRVSVPRGKALYLPAGNIHAYLSGLAVELMSASDNVLRGGLTPKHVDVPELLAVLDTSPMPVPFLPGRPEGPGVEAFRPGVSDFALFRITPGAGPSSVALPGPGIALCLRGEAVLAGAGSRVVLRRGEAVYVTPEEEVLEVSGSCEVFLATTNVVQAEAR